MLDLRKPDGRELTLYARQPLDAALTAPSPFSEALDADPHMRWHPLRGEWVTYAAYRQTRTFLPPAEYNPLAPASSGHASEVPVGKWDIAVFDNRFPALSESAASQPALVVPTRPALGKCEVVVFTQDPQASLGALPLPHIELLFEVWADRSERATRKDWIEFVLPFENRGREVGVTLHHPHGQIYAYPVVPPVPANMQAHERAHFRSRGTTLLGDLIGRELQANERIIYRGEHAVAWVPACARYPYEAWVATIRPVPGFSALSDEQRADLARALKTLLLKYDGLWNRPFPYLMAWYQAPCDGHEHPASHLHAEFYPPYRTRDKLKYLAGTELAGGLYAMDALPEEKARELQAVVVEL